MQNFSGNFPPRNFQDNFTQQNIFYIVVKILECNFSAILFAHTTVCNVTRMIILLR
jgi:hypothetical protein